MISVVVPCYNAAPFLAQAIDSIRAQSRPADEIIVVDDCSTDGSAAIAAKFPVRLIRTEINSGHAAARNLGIEATRGDLIAWLDADDFWDAQHLELVVGLLERFPEAGVAFSPMRLVGTREGQWSKSPCHGQPANVFWDCFRRTIVPATTAVTRREVMREVGGFDPTIRIAPDFDLWLRISRNHLFVSEPTVTASYRWHPQQISARQHEQVRSTYQSRARFVTRTFESGDYELARDAERELLAIWEGDLSRAWRSGRSGDLRFLLSLAPLIPQGAGAARRWRLRAMVPGFVVRSLTTAARPFRKAIHSVRTP